ncbi:hypothetical protein NDU88_001295 [Pleurodeles waltl]|uniref:Uncharacterized protein n=1 Tax=Pleurodeles waltl TaxID=8319 RepID=A0AAV7THX4_PLEWA|nr:hypothetical protein NDU88_001295 [Pleurodeles waltl]
MAAGGRLRSGGSGKKRPRALTVARAAADASRSVSSGSFLVCARPGAVRLERRARARFLQQGRACVRTDGRRYHAQRLARLFDFAHAREGLRATPPPPRRKVRERARKSGRRQDVVTVSRLFLAEVRL